MRRHFAFSEAGYLELFREMCQGFGHVRLEDVHRDLGVEFELVVLFPAFLQVCVGLWHGICGRYNIVHHRISFYRFSPGGRDVGTLSEWITY